MKPLSNLITNLKDLSKEELNQRLENIRSNRRSGYMPPQRKSKSKQMPAMFQGIDEETAKKVLEELLKGMEVPSE